MKRLSPKRLAAIQDQFVSELPRITKVLNFRLRRLHGEERDEATAEALALSWAGYLDLCKKGRDPGPLVQKIAEFAAKRVLSGGRLVGMHPAGDALSPVCQHRHGVRVQTIPDHESVEAAPEVISALIDRKAPSPSDASAFAVDLAAWLDSLDPKHRSFADDLIAGQNTIDTAKTRGVSRGTTSNMRRHLKETYQAFER